VGRISEVIDMGNEVTRVTKVRAAGGRVLHVRFAGDRRDLKSDLTGLIARSVHFAPLMDDAESFAKVVIVEDGLGLAWPIQTKWGRLDVSASTLRRIAEEQEPMTGADFAEWRKVLGLSLAEAANLLGVGRRTIMGYLKKDALPPIVAIACRALARRPLRAGAENQSASRVKFGPLSIVDSEFFSRLRVPIEVPAHDPPQRGRLRTARQRHRAGIGRAASRFVLRG
jgi:transcriptional regulator with XRE-family HTH domain